MVSTSAGLSFSIPHLGNIRERVLEAASKALEYVPQLEEIMGRWQGRNLSDPEVREFNDRTLKLAGRDVWQDLQLCRREIDAPNTLWNVFNRTQENLMRGGITYKTGRGRNCRSRPIGSVRKNLDLNKRLWDLAEEFLPA